MANLAAPVESGDTGGVSAVHPETRGRQLARRAAIPATLIGVMAYWTALAWQHFAYFDDDLILFGKASEWGLGLQFLSYNLYEHFSPIDHVFYWLELSISPLNELVGMIIAGLVLIGMLLSLNWALREAAVSTLRRVAVVGVIGTCLPILTVTTYWGQAIYIPVGCAFSLLVVAAHLRGLNRHLLRWHVVAVCLSIGGVLISERTFFTPVFLIALDAALLGRASTWRAVPMGLWKQRYTYLPLFVVSAAGVAFIAKYYYYPYPQGGLIASLRLIVIAYSRWFVPTMFGFWRIGGISNALAVVVAAMSAALAGALIAAHRRNVWPLLLFGLVFCTLYGFLGVERLGILPQDAEAADVQYMVWVLPLAALAVALLVPPRWWDAWRSRWRRPLAVGIALAGVAILADGLVSLSVSGVMAQRQSANQYFTTLRSEAPRLTSSAVSVMPLSASSSVAAPFIWPYQRLEIILPLMFPGIHVGALDPGASPFVIDASGDLQPALLATDAGLVDSGVSEQQFASTGGTVSTRQGELCFTADSPQGYLRVGTAAAVQGGTLMVELSYSSSSSTSILFTTVAPSSARGNVNLSQLEAGSHTAVFALDGDELTNLQVGGFRVGTPLCIQSLSIVHPVVLGSDGRCRTVDESGDVGGVTACPSDEPRR